MINFLDNIIDASLQATDVGLSVSIIVVPYELHTHYKMR